MSEIKKRVEESASFYTESFLDFDLQLAKFNLRTFLPHLKGEIGLELGPALGFMTGELAQHFTELHIVEGAKELLDKIPNYSNVTRHHSLFEEFSPSVTFDTIVMGHVLEHISDPVGICRRIFRWLNNDGVFLVSVPNAKSLHRLVAKEMGLLKSEYELNERDHQLGHYRVYDLDLLVADLRSAGFTIASTGGIFLKPLSNGQIEDSWTDEMIEGFFNVGKQFPDYCAEIYAVCTKK